MITARDRERLMLLIGHEKGTYSVPQLMQSWLAFYGPRSAPTRGQIRAMLRQLKGKGIVEMVGEGRPQLWRTAKNGDGNDDR